MMICFGRPDEEHILDFRRCDCMASEEKPVSNEHRKGEGVWVTLAGNNYVLNFSEAKRLMRWLRDELESPS